MSVTVSPPAVRRLRSSWKTFTEQNGSGDPGRSRLNRGYISAGRQLVGVPETLSDRAHDVIGRSGARLADLIGLERLLRRALAGRDVAVRGDGDRRVRIGEVVDGRRVAGHLAC